MQPLRPPEHFMITNGDTAEGCGRSLVRRRSTRASDYGRNAYADAADMGHLRQYRHV